MGRKIHAITDRTCQFYTEISSNLRLVCQQKTSSQIAHRLGGRALNPKVVGSRPVMRRPEKYNTAAILCSLKRYFSSKLSCVKSHAALLLVNFFSLILVALDLKCNSRCFPGFNRDSNPTSLLGF